MTEPEGLLEAASSVLLIDWPSRDVPDTLVRAGYTVIVKSGPGPEDYSAQELRDGLVVARKLDRAPGQVDLVYAHRPFEELARIVVLANELGAKAVWRQSGFSSAETRDPNGCWVTAEDSRQARSLVESANLAYVEDIYIADAVRELRAAEAIVSVEDHSEPR